MFKGFQNLQRLSHKPLAACFSQTPWPCDDVDNPCKCPTSFLFWCLGLSSLTMASLTALHMMKDLKGNPSINLL